MSVTLSREEVVKVGTSASVCLCVVAVSMSVGAEQGLVAHWDFDEGESDVLRDRSRNENHSRIKGARWATLRTTVTWHGDR